MDAKTWLASAGHDPDHGARPLKRIIQRHIDDPLARALIDGTYADGDKITVIVNQAGTGLELT